MDDTYLWGEDHAHLQNTLTALERALHKHGLSINPKKTRIICSTKDPRRFTIGRQWVQPETGDAALTVLGSPVSFQGGPPQLAAEMGARARAAWGKNKDLLTAKTALKRRLQLHNVLVRQSALWAAETWPIQSTLLKAANTQQLQQAAQSSPDTAAGPQTESTQQEEAEASRVKQQPTRERLTGETGGAHSPATGTAQQKADADKPAAKPQKGGDPPSNQTKPGGDGRATQAFSFYSSAAKAAFRPAVPPGQWQQPAVPKRPPPQPPSDSETSWPSEDPQTTTRWSRHTPPDHAERGDAADAQDAGSRGEERSSQAEPAQADRGAGGGQHDKHAGKGPGQHGAVDRAVGGREQHGHPSPATRRGTQGGQGRTLKKARHQMAELMRSHTEETLAALDQAYGEASSDQYERDRRAEGQERVVGTKAATRAAAAAEHRQEAMQLARSIELHGVEAHLSAAATSLATDGEMGRRGRQGPPPPNAFQIATSELNGVIHRPRGSWPR
eukprot:s258_g21.t1